MEQLAHREWGAGQRPKGRAGIFQGHRHQILCHPGFDGMPCLRAIIQALMLFLFWSAFLDTSTPSTYPGQSMI